MSTLTTSVFLGLAIIIVYIGVPVLTVWGWIRLARHAKPETLSMKLSLIGFVLGSVSVLFAFSSVLYAGAIGAFPYDPRLIKIFRSGFLLSLGALAFSLCGAWRPNPLRWQAPALAGGMLLFWFIAAIGQ